MVRGLGRAGQVGEFSRHTTGFVRQEAKEADRKMPVTDEAESGVLQLATVEDLRRRGALAEAMAACQMPISDSFLDAEPNIRLSELVIRYCVFYMRQKQDSISNNRNFGWQN